MARDSRSRSDSFETENTGGLISGFLAEEDELDRGALWRLGSWAAATVGAVIVALLANQSSVGMRREQLASADLARQSQQIQTVAKDSQSEARRLASAIETLNSDRDRLYSRVAVLEQGLDSVTGAITRQDSAVKPPQAAAPPETPATAQKPPPAAAVSPAVAPPPQTTAPAETPAAAQKSSAAPAVSPVVATIATAPEKPPAPAAEPGPAPAPSGMQAAASAPAASAPAANVPAANVPAANLPVATPATPLVAAKSMMAPPDPAAGKLIEPNAPPRTVTAEPIPEIVVAATSPVERTGDAESSLPGRKLAIQRTEFGLDVGGANSLPGLRALWRGLLKSRSNAALATLRPIIVIKEANNGLGMQLRLVAGPIDDAASAAKICAGMIANDRPCTTTVFEGQRLAMGGEEPAAGETKPASPAKPYMRRHYIPKRAAKDEPPKSEPSTLSLIFGKR